VRRAERVSETGDRALLTGCAVLTCTSPRSPKYFSHATPRTTARAHPLQPSPTIRTRRLRCYKSRVSTPSLTPPCIPSLPSLPLDQARRHQHRRRRKVSPPFPTNFCSLLLLSPSPPLDLDPSPCEISHAFLRLEWSWVPP
jgi:hypothetical protein